jgi:hypothetical protein
MRGKLTGALGLLGVGILLKNPQVHDDLNRLVEEWAHKAGAWLSKVLSLRRRGAKSSESGGIDTGISSETPPLETNGGGGTKRKAKKPSSLKGNRATPRKAPRAKATHRQQRTAPGS